MADDDFEELEGDIDEPEDLDEDLEGDIEEDLDEFEDDVDEVLEDDVAEDEDADDVADDEDGDDDGDEETDEALEDLEAEELELLDDEMAEALLVDEAAELRAIRREELTMNMDAHLARSDEFVCQSCYLVKRMSQLANKRKMYCHDCAS